MDKSIKFPKHDFGLILEHNPHKRFQQTIKEYVERDCFEFSSEEDKLKCIEIDDLWVLQLSRKFCRVFLRSCSL